MTYNRQSIGKDKAIGIIAFIDSRIEDIQKFPGARDSAEDRLSELRLIRIYCEELQKGERMVEQAIGKLIHA